MLNFLGVVFVFLVGVGLGVMGTIHAVGANVLKVKKVVNCTEAECSKSWQVKLDL